MSDVDNGKPAYPVVAGNMVYNTGMTLRDYFAGQAISGATGPSPEGWSLSPQAQAEWAYDIADAMLFARNKEEK